MDEKSPWPPQSPTRAQTARRHGSKWRFPLGGLVASIILFTYLTHSRYFIDGSEHRVKDPSNPSNDPMDPWASIAPSADLTWHPCYTLVNPSFLCARLTVPMDHSRDDDDGSPKDPSKPPLLLNPGGPGGSGTLLALLSAPALQALLGADQPVLGFDPRGVGFTTPRADCWATPPHAPCPGCPDDAARGLMHRLEWEQVNAAYGLVGESDAGLRLLEAGQRAVNDLCRGREGRHADGGSGLAWAGTTEVVRDMVRIVDRWDEWVESEGGEVEAELRGKLVYWGFSYGTYLGAVFAKMYPERVGRVLLDGVVDAEVYEQAVWKGSLVDTDKVLGEFFRYCAAAGRKCDLYRKGDGKEDVRRRYEAVMERLRTSPPTFTHPEHFYPVVLRESLVKLIAFTVLYSPIQGFPALAYILNHLYEGKDEALSGMFQDAELLCSISGNPILMGMMTDAQRAIMCSDKTEPVNMTLPEWTAAHKTMAGTSQFADIWIGVMMQCNGWDISHPHQTPRDPWPTTSEIETANPILFLSNTYDPVTPLFAAVKMALKFKDAGLLEQKSAGHCTISTVSRCTAKVVREYVASGKVPPPPTGVDGDFNGDWTRCEVDEAPWESASAEMVTTLGVEEREMVEAWQHLQRVMKKMERWGVGKETGVDMEAVMAFAQRNGELGRTPL